MKNIKFLMLLAFSFVLLHSCSSDDNDKIPPVVRSSMKLVQSFNENNHVIEVYSTHKNFMVGYNPIEVMIKDASTNEYFSNIEVSDFMPMLHMPNMMHSCPKSEMFDKKEGIASGFAVFIMPGNKEMPWKLSFTYKVNDNTYKISDKEINVTNPDRAMLAKGNKYFLAYIEPTNPIVGINSITTKVYKMESMISFPEVKNYKILLDPRMPGMGNHSSPNNQPLTYDANTGLYNGKVNFSMTGYWKLNLQLQNEKGEVVAGNAIDDKKDSSNLYWEIEF